MLPASIYATSGRQGIASAGYVSTRPATILAPSVLRLPRQPMRLGAVADEGQGRARFLAIRAKSSTKTPAWSDLPAHFVASLPACRLQSHREQLLHFLRSRGTRASCLEQVVSLHVNIK
jgi:hypothetical protein